ncbi:hypothetical protein Y032_0324g2540 [Ancylostoma ceylanicum]|uniref:RWD domain-containing protein n=1 Tax=Ancylostoma ceylanicum TaxID=53326 RepID=A0A016S0A6_9BILA|nr:hypothetical protein Y032_0324g2540 [Ancylostoma ceylanicum]
MEAEAEIEALRSIFGDDIVIETNQDKSVTVVRRKVRPNDEEGVSSASLVVEFELSREYPEVSPNVRLLNPRGISEESHQQLIGEVRQRLADNIGMPIIFDILQHCADFIFEHQHSSSLSCPICLCPMTSASVSVTPCDHYAHTECFELHREHTRKQLGEKLAARDFKMCHDIDRSLRCPVCREVMEQEVEPILPPSSPPRRGRKSAPRERESTSWQLPVQESQNDFDFDWGRWRKQQALLMKIYERQKEKGGIIDLEEERKKNLVTEDTKEWLPICRDALDADANKGFGTLPQAILQNGHAKCGHSSMSRRDGAVAQSVCLFEKDCTYTGLCPHFAYAHLLITRTTHGQHLHFMSSGMLYATSPFL